MSSTTESHSPISRRRLNTSSEEAYAGPSSTDLSTSQLSSPRIKRVKREKCRSDESETLSSNITLVIEDFRCAGPIYIPFPRRHTRSRKEIHEVWDEMRIENLISQVLKEQNLREALTEVVVIESEDQVADCTIIQVDDEFVDARWIKAAEAVISLFQNLNFRDMNVEIVNEFGLAKTTSAVIPTTEPLVINWAIVKPIILQALRPNSTWLSIDILTRNKELAVSKKTISTPSIVIRIDRDSQENWTGPRDQIDFFLQNNKDYAHFAVEFIRATDENFMIFYEPYEQEQHQQGKLWQTKGYVGASISPTDSNGSGTCGCFLQVQFGASVDCYALTNFHVVVPMEESELEREQSIHLSQWTKHGIRPDDERRKQLVVNMPSRADHQAALLGCQQTILQVKEVTIGGASYDGIQDMVNEGIDLATVMAKSDQDTFMMRKSRIEENQENITKAKSRYEPDNAIFGHVYAASGARKSGDKIMDWALLEIRADRKPQKNQLYGISCPTMRPHTSPTPNEEVFKIGRSTGFTKGTINAIERTKHLKGWRIRDDGSFEHEIGTVWTIVGQKREPFCLPGDSGSAIFNDVGDFKGLLVGGDHSERSLLSDVSFFISAEDLFSDMKVITGADSVEVLWSEDE